jgi:hypothetical protein
MNPELEISLSPRGAGQYRASFRLRKPGAAAPTEVQETVTFNAADLNGAAADPPAYGTALGRALFGPTVLRDAWVDACAAAGQSALRVRLSLDTDDLVLRRARWEAIGDPRTGRPLLLADQGIWFSRVLDSADPRPVRIRTKPALRVLVAVAAPPDLENLRLGGRTFASGDLVAAEEEIAAVRAALRPMTGAIDVLPAGGQQPTVDNILRCLRTGVDLFYLVAHGGLENDVPKLLLVDEAGNGKEVDGRELADGIGQLWHRPALVVLSSCQSAGAPKPLRLTGVPAADLVDTALGAELGRAGVPAVLSMLGNVFQGTGRPFVHKFLEQVATHGQIDRAAGEARFEVRGEPDHWAPVLSTRLTDNRLWQEPSSGPAARFAGWPGLLRKLRLGQCVPVLGSGLLERLMGPTRELARTWAEEDKVALTRDRQLDLPQVAQYALITNGRDHVQNRYLEVLTAAVDSKSPTSKGYPADFDPAQRLQERLSEAVAAYGPGEQPDGHAMLARLNCPLYITTNPDGLLPDALRRAGKAPVEQHCNWLTPAENPPGFPPDGPTKPTPAAPLVCQLYGHLSDASSVVLTEDDYFRFLIGMSRVSANPSPSFVQQILTRSTLLFLGFRINDWDFRAFLNFLLSREAAKSRKDFGLRDVAVQIDPAEDDAPDPDQVRDYLKSLFGRADIDIYWGSADKFLEELYDQWPQTP